MENIEIIYATNQSKAEQISMKMEMAKFIVQRLRTAL